MCSESNVPALKSPELNVMPQSGLLAKTLEPEYGSSVVNNIGVLDLYMYLQCILGDNGTCYRLLHIPLCRVFIQFNYTILR